MTQGVRVRPAEPSDAPALAELLNAIIARGGTTAYEQPFTSEALAEEMITDPDVICCFVAEDLVNGMLGFQCLVRAEYLPADVGDIATFTRVGLTQRGVGSQLFASTREAAAGQGLSAINATIRADNAGGLAFYTRLGFVDHTVYPAIPLANGTPVDRVSKRLSMYKSF